MELLPYDNCNCSKDWVNDYSAIMTDSGLLNKYNIYSTTSKLINSNIDIGRLVVVDLDKVK